VSACTLPSVTPQLEKDLLCVFAIITKDVTVHVASQLLERYFVLSVS